MADKLPSWMTGPKAKPKYYGDDSPAAKARFAAEVKAGKAQGTRNLRDQQKPRSVAPADDKRPVSFGAGSMSRPLPSKGSCKTYESR
jgi:hypothetical protein